MFITPKKMAFAGVLATLVGCTSWCVLLRAQSTGVQSGIQAGAPGISAKQVATEAIENEVKLIQYDRSYLRYRVHVKDAKGDQVREVVESKDGSVTRVILRDDHTLSPDQDSKERERLQEMLDSPRAFERQSEKDKTGKKLAIELIRMMPDSMIFNYAPGQPQREGKGDGPVEIVVDFKPDPGWKPPNMASEALTGVEGRCWMDAKTHFLTRMEATIFQGVNFGWGMLAHIYPGGKLTMEQAPVGGSRWVVDRFTGRLTVREMMVRTVSQNTDVFASDFAQVPEMGYQDAIRMLLNHPMPPTQAAMGR